MKIRSYQEFSHEIQEKIRNCSKSGIIRKIRKFDGLVHVHVNLLMDIRYNYEEWMCTASFWGGMGLPMHVCSADMKAYLIFMIIERFVSV